LEDYPENYPICFMLMSALHRLWFKQVRLHMSIPTR
jgi:hypothetical protein